MNFRLTLSVLGILLVFLSVTLLLPIPVSFYFSDGHWHAFAIPAVAAAGIGAALYFGFRNDEELSLREGFGIVTFGWFWFSVFGAAPYVISGALPGMIDAFFESISGFTTTGATVINDIPLVPKSVLFWRAMSQWIGGMGIIVLSLAILPYLGIGGMQLYTAEVSGPSKERLGSRIQDTAKGLWGVYVALTAILTGALVLGDVPLFDAVCHAFTTTATGGFSNHNESVGFYGPYVQWVITLFMLLCGINFALHYKVLFHGPKAWKTDETVAYAGIYGVAILAIYLFVHDRFPDIETGVRTVAFQVVSMGTTTGYGTADYVRWPMFAQYMLFLLTFMGGCAGSTSGGLKVIRIVVLVKQAFVQVFRLIHPKGVKYLMVDHQAVPLNVIQGVLGFFVLNMMIIAGASLLLTAVGLDFVTGGTAVVSSIFTIGPAFGELGPSETFSELPGFAKLVLAACMLIGRLETFTVFVLLIPSFWRK